ncbi:hypothetical protein [Coleofasciculus sp. H7-2]|uniref:hypothetical protein n=1 Tax=Coleofasciculus sp. H7-2 TaxID=3351545 RepID=UPI00366C99B9
MLNAIKNLTLGIGYGLYLTALAPKSQRDAALARASRIVPQVEVEVPRPVATEQPKVEIDLNTLDSGTLRKLCTQYGIAWRNVRGQGKHLTKAAMVFQLERVAVAA